MCAEPVNATWSWTWSSSSSPAGLPIRSWIEPSGTMPDATMLRTTASVTYDVCAAGFTMLGIPARNAGPSFSSIPQTGKLNALICTITPGRLVKTCWPTKVPPLPSGIGSPSR